MIMTNVWCNGHGWICGSGSDGLRFTQSKAGAKPFDLYGQELFRLRIQIEHTIMCNYDLILIN